MLGAGVITGLKGAAAGFTLLGDLALGILLAKNGNDFGLFKLYMYAQPFLAATVAITLSSVSRRRTMLAAAALSVAVVAVQLGTLNDYVNSSRNPIDLRHASDADLLQLFIGSSQLRPIRSSP